MFNVLILTMGPGGSVRSQTGHGEKGQHRDANQRGTKARGAGNTGNRHPTQGHSHTGARRATRPRATGPHTHPQTQSPQAQTQHNPPPLPAALNAPSVPRGTAKATDRPPRKYGTPRAARVTHTLDWAEEPPGPPGPEAAAANHPGARGTEAPSTGALVSPRRTPRSGHQAPHAEAPTHTPKANPPPGLSQAARELVAPSPPQGAAGPMHAPAPPRPPNHAYEKRTCQRGDPSNSTGSLSHFLFYMDPFPTHFFRILMSLNETPQTHV